MNVTINTILPTQEQVAEQVNKAIENGAKAGIEETRNEKIAELNALELVSANYKEMKALAKYFDVKSEDQKAETLITALTELKNTLNQQ